MMVSIILALKNHVKEFRVACRYKEDGVVLWGGAERYVSNTVAVKQVSVHYPNDDCECEVVCNGE